MVVTKGKYSVISKSKLQLSIDVYLKLPSQRPVAMILLYYIVKEKHGHNILILYIFCIPNCRRTILRSSFHINLVDRLQGHNILTLRVDPVVDGHF